MTGVEAVPAVIQRPAESQTNVETYLPYLLFQSVRSTNASRKSLSSRVTADDMGDEWASASVQVPPTGKHNPDLLGPR